MSDPLVEALREGLREHLGVLAEADYEIYHGAQQRGEAVIEAVARGDTLDGDDREMFGTLIAIRVGRLTWQTGYESVPRPPWVDVAARLRRARAIIDAARDLCDEETYFRVAGYARRAAALEFRSDHRIVSVEEALRRGESARLPPMLSIGASLGPTSWSADQGPEPRCWLSIRIGGGGIGDGVALALIQDRPRGSSLELYAYHDLSWHRVAFEPGADRPTPIEGLDAITGDPALAGWHLAIRPHPGMTSAELVNLQSPFDVVAQVPARPLR